MLTKYHKIKAPFLRDTETKKLTNNFILPEFEYLKDLPWIWTEKIDGTNIRIYWDGYQLSLHGRTDNAQIPAEFMEYYLDKFIRSGLDKTIEQEFGETEVIFFGEGFGGKIQGNKAYGDTRFALFDIMIGSHYCDRDTVDKYAKMFGLEIVPVVLVGTIDKAIEFAKKGYKSEFGDIQMEGLVGTPYCQLLTRFGERIITKVKYNDFKDYELEVQP